MGITDRLREGDVERAAKASAAAAREARAGENSGFNGALLSVERSLAAFLRTFDRGFPADPREANAARLAVEAARAALGPLRALRLALALGDSRALCDQIHAEDEAAQAAR